MTTTSGLAWKIPGRVGDSPILGAGLYVDGSAGAAGSTGRGEANLYGLCSFLIVELLRRGMAPKDAGLEALRRVQIAWEALTDPPASVAWSAPPADDLQATEQHLGSRRFPWWIVAIAVLMAIFIITAYAGSVPVATP